MTFLKTSATNTTNTFRQCVRHITRTATTAIAAVLAVATLTSACAETPRTATNFCRQLALEVPAITQPTATQAEVSQMLDRYKRLGKVAPLAIEEDWQSLTELLAVASRTNPNDAESVQAVIDMSYATEKAADAAAKWIRETCGVDISTGLNVGPTP
ncbi:MAG: hypothetical protein O3A62_02135 [Actinomycetota bacterium]|nr:hypothetical protein [Actinomycetota bacterium]MDA3003856.1 hypothetical protein [Actinomycetota bacterium]